MDNGFAPEWITLQKEIRVDIKDLKNILTEYRSYIGEIPLNDADAHEWSTVVKRFEYRETEINKKIDKYNLITPIMDQQLCQIQYKRIVDEVLNSTSVRKNKMPNKMKQKKENYESSNKTFLSSLLWWT